MNQRKPARGRQNQLFTPNHIHPNPKHLFQLNVGNDQIHHQKLSSSQLIHFLKTSRKLLSSADEVKYRPNITESSFDLMQQQNISAAASVDQRAVALSRGPSSRGCTDIKVEVRRIDYGDVVCVSLWDVKELCGEAASKPVQALQVSLVNVRPVNGETWCFEAISWFKSKVQNKTLYARLYPEEVVLVELFMEKGKIGAMRQGRPHSHLNDFLKYYRNL
ncbi:uncharacterized protein LOC131552933 [Onychostoma macrolepis]|uniref:uncharacterized protein LOC131552933 n=1 Tax=Onychostoma macrolepis TaxID=369639 RepID=UPI00272C9EA6|nr:uncharacterized protein LOC131552933 [Onychostoma macrolepis]